MFRPMTLLLTGLLGIAAAPCAIADDEPATPRVFKGAPMKKGSWRVEMLEMRRAGHDSPAGSSMNGMSICMDQITQMAKQQRQPGDKRKCTTSVLKDTPDVAQIEAKCERSTYRSTITRESAVRYLIEGEGSGGAGEPFSMKARYTYEGPCKEGAGAFSMDKNSPQCKKMRDQISRMSPDKSCGKLSGEQRAMCEQQIQQSLARINAICP